MSEDDLRRRTEANMQRFGIPKGMGDPVADDFMRQEAARARLLPTHVLTITVPLRLVSYDEPSRVLEACLALVRLAFPAQVCDDIEVAVKEAS